MNTPINPKPRLNLRFLHGVIFGVFVGFFLAYSLFYFEVTPFECTPETVIIRECDAPRGVDQDPRFGQWLGPNEAQSIMRKFTNEPLKPEMNKTIGGRIGKANLQRMLCDMPPDSQWVHFRFGIAEALNTDGNTQNRLVVLVRNGAFSNESSAVASHSRTIMNVGFCPIDCGNN
jgi:hypothetical protein